MTTHRIHVGRSGCSFLRLQPGNVAGKMADNSADNAAGNASDNAAGPWGNRRRTQA